MTFPIPEGALARHIAVLGQTGSGKTSTEKLIVEHVVDAGFRVCVLDVLKSDWWGITSSASGKSAGLPFRILGGPRGHVPLHSSAGKVIGELVGSGKLPLSIIDMADFEAGGVQRFFVDFSQALWRSTKGVIYLVIEEAHDVAPKERAGFGAENLSIHWAKKLATGSRSKGIRLLVATQSVQQLHNRVLGSCETLIAHRMFAPADQDPVLKWLRANAGKEQVAKVEAELARLPDGTAWAASGSLGFFERIKLPKYRTYDNSATPEGDVEGVTVKTAPVDPDELKALIGDAMKEAEARDVPTLQKRIRVLEAEVRKRETPGKVPAVTSAPVLEAAHRKAVGAAQQVGYQDGYTTGHNHGFGAGVQASHQHFYKRAMAAHGATEALARAFDAMPEWKGVKAPIKVQTEPVSVPIAPPRTLPKPEFKFMASEASESGLSAVQQRILNATAEMQDLCRKAPPRQLVATMAGYAHVNSKGFANALSSLSTSGRVIYPSSGTVAVTEEGRALAVTPETPATSQAIQARVMEMLGGAASRILRPLIELYPEGMGRQELANAAGYGHVNSKGFANMLSRLSSLGFVAYKEGKMVEATEILFPDWQ